MKFAGAFEGIIPIRNIKDDLCAERSDDKHVVSSIQRGERGRLGGTIVYGTEIVPDDADIPRVRR
ncbi:MAG: hypothetical protein K9M03_02905 [Kiritimatiellales bacterium]|nr:hypothetical protein [Kiritimatiellales bacterium]